MGVAKAVGGERSAGSARTAKDENVLVRLDRRSKSLVRRAATLRGISVSDYVRSRIVPLAEQDVEEAETGVLRLRKADQIALWRALQHPSPPTKAQKALGRLIRSVI